MLTILPRRALPRGRLTGLGATRDFYHGLLAPLGHDRVVLVGEEHLVELFDVLI